jgi:uroporphyrinogen-III synthase
LKVKNLLVSQPKPDLEKSPYADIIKKYNVKIEFKKFFKIEGVPSKDFRQNRINLLEYSAVIFTSKNAVDHYFRLCTEMRIQVPDTMKYFCVTEAIALYLQKYIQYRKRKIFHGNNLFSDLMESIKKHKTEAFLLPCSETYNQEVLKILDENKINYTKTEVYRNVPDDLSKTKLQNFDMLVFFSPSGIKSLFHNFPKFKQNSTVIATFGETTSHEAKEAGLKVSVEAPNPQAPSMTMAIDQFLQKNNKTK